MINDTHLDWICLVIESSPHFPLCWKPALRHSPSKSIAFLLLDSYVISHFTTLCTSILWIFTSYTRMEVPQTYGAVLPSYCAP